MRGGQDGARGSALAHRGRPHQDQGDALGHHRPVERCCEKWISREMQRCRPGAEDAQQDEDGGQHVPEDQLEGDVQGVGEGRGGQDAHLRDDSCKMYLRS